MATIIAELTRFDKDGNDIEGGTRIMVDVDRPWTAEDAVKAPTVRVSFNYGNEKSVHLELDAVELMAAVLKSRDHA